MSFRVSHSCRILKSLGSSYYAKNVQRVPHGIIASCLSTDGTQSMDSTPTPHSASFNPENPVAPSSHESLSIFYDPIAQKFVNMMMWDGKKSLSQSILKEAMQIIKTTQLSKLKSKGSTSSDVVVDPLVIFHQALENSQPIMGTIGVRRGGKLHHVPYPLPAKRRQFLASKWIIHAARDRSGHNMAKKLAAELLEAYNNQGTAIKRKQDLHRLAEANRAFAHFRW